MSVIFGNNVTGGSTTTIEGTIKGSIFTTGAGNYTVEKIAVFYNPSLTSYPTKCAIYEGTALVANSSTDVVTGTTGPNWRDFTYTGTKPVLSPNTAYILVVWTSALAGTSVIFLDAATAGSGRAQTLTYAASFPDPATFTNNNSRFSIYATLWVGITIAGSAPLNFIVGSAMAYAPAGGAAYEITGSAELAFSVAATSLAHNRNFILAGSAGLSLTPAAGLDYTRNATIAGAVPLSFLVQSSIGYTREITVAGTVLLNFLVSSTTQFTSVDVACITFAVSTENRTFTVKSENRTFAVSAENRVFTVARERVQ